MNDKFAIRIFQSYLCEGIEILFAYCLGIFIKYHKEIENCDSDLQFITILKKELYFNMTEEEFINLQTIRYGILK